MSKPRSVYVVFMWCVFLFQIHFHCHLSYNLTKTDALVLCTFFLNICYYILDVLAHYVDEEREY